MARGFVGQKQLATGAATARVWMMNESMMPGSARSKRRQSMRPKSSAVSVISHA